MKLKATWRLHSQAEVSNFASAHGALLTGYMSVQETLMSS
jgi:hypothetical protein